MSDTFGSLVDRTFRDWLAPPDDQPARMLLDIDMSTASNTLTYDPRIMLAEQELLLGPGTLIEIDHEQMTVATVDAPNKQISFLIRGVNGTEVTTHDDGATITIAPKFGRRTVYDALASATIGLYPRLYRRRATQLTLSSGYTEIPADAEIPESFTFFNGDYPCFSRARILELPTLSTGKALQCLDAPAGTTGTLVYRGRFVRPTSENSLLEKDLGIEPEYETAIIVRAVSHVIANRDLDRLTTEFLTRQLEAQSNQDGITGTRLREALIRYYEYLMAELTRNTEAVQVHNGWTRAGA